MIVGIVSLTQRPIDRVLDTFKDVGIIVSENDLLPKLGIENLVNNVNLKYSALSQLENQYTNVIVYGNVFLDREVCQRILNHGGQVILAIEDSPTLDYPYKGRYFEMNDVQKFNEGFQSKWCKERLLKAIYWAVDREELPSIDFSVVTSSKEEEEPVFLKIGNGKMVMFIPQTINLERQRLAGTEYTTLVVKAPALDDVNLQKLEVFGR